MHKKAVTYALLFRMVGERRKHKLPVEQMERQMKTLWAEMDDGARRDADMACAKLKEKQK